MSATETTPSSGQPESSSAENKQNDKPSYADIFRQGRAEVAEVTGACEKTTLVKFPREVRARLRSSY